MNTEQSGASDLRIPLLSIPSPSASRHSRDNSGGLEDFSSCLDRFSDDRGRDRAGQPSTVSDVESGRTSASASSEEIEDDDSCDFTELTGSDDLNLSGTASIEDGPVNPNDEAPLPVTDTHPRAGDRLQSDGSEAVMRASAKDAPKLAKEAAGSDAKASPATVASGKAGDAMVARVAILPSNAAGQQLRAAPAVVADVGNRVGKDRPMPGQGVKQVLPGANAARDVESPAAKPPTKPVVGPAKEPKAMVLTEQKTVSVQAGGARAVAIQDPIEQSATTQPIESGKPPVLVSAEAVPVASSGNPKPPAQTGPKGNIPNLGSALSSGTAQKDAKATGVSVNLPNGAKPSVVDVHSAGKGLELGKNPEMNATPAEVLSKETGALFQRGDIRDVGQSHPSAKQPLSNTSRNAFGNPPEATAQFLKETLASGSKPTADASANAAQLVGKKVVPVPAPGAGNGQSLVNEPIVKGSDFRWMLDGTPDALESPSMMSTSNRDLSIPMKGSLFSQSSRLDGSDAFLASNRSGWSGDSSSGRNEGNESGGSHPETGSQSRDALPSAYRDVAKGVASAESAETRSSMGSQASGNAAERAAASQVSVQVVNQIVQHLERMRQAEKNHVRVVLSDDGANRLTADIRMVGGRIQASFEGNADAMAQIRKEWEIIRDHAQELGVALDEPEYLSDPWSGEDSILFPVAGPSGDENPSVIQHNNQSVRPVYKTAAAGSSGPVHLYA